MNGFDVINVPSCGLDVHKEKIDACVIGSDGQAHHKVFDTMRASLSDLRSWILSFNCLHVLMESTGVYWIPIYELLEEVPGMDVGVGNSQAMKNVPGRPKRDKDDAGWVAKLCMFGLILKSFIVGRKFRELREYTRYHKKLVQERSRQVNRIEKLLQMNGFKLSSVLSDITGVSGRRLLEKLVGTGSVTVADVRQALDRRVKMPAEEVERAINGTMKPTSRLLMGRMLKRLDTCDREISEIYDMMVEMSKEYTPQIRIIDSIPGLGELSAIYIIAEISTELSSFETKKHITAWAGLAPKDNESAGKLKSGKTKKANIYIKSILLECAWAATRVRGTRISNWFWRNEKRLGKKKAVTAVARKLLVYIYAMLKSGELYDGSPDVADTEKCKAEKLESARKIVERQANDLNLKRHRVNTAQDSFALEPLMSQQATDGLAPVTMELCPEIINEPPKRKRGRPRKIDVIHKLTESQLN